MKTKWHRLVISFFCILCFGLISCSADPHKSLFTTRRQVFKFAKQSTTQDRRSMQRSVQSSTLVTAVIPVGPGARIQADLPYAPDVSVTCSSSDFVVRVKPAFYGLGANAQELTLGSDCRSNGVLRPQGVLLFTYPLTACDGVREVPHDSLVYKYVLRYEPSPKRFPSRAHPIDVNIECHYQRDHSVYQLAVQPTWQTVIQHKNLKGRAMEFQISLMDDSWTTPAKSKMYLLGQAVNIQVSAPHLPPGLKLYINSCHAAPSSGSKSSLKYSLVDNFGCMLDSRHEPGASRFVSQTDKTVRFSLKTFQFTVDPDIKVTIHCKLSVSSESPGPAQKSCTYQDHRWRALTGQDSICECCESTCVASKPRRSLLEGFAMSRPLMVSDQAHTAENRHISPSVVSRWKEDEEKLDDKDLEDQKLLGSAVVDKHDDEEENGNKWLEESETIHGAMMEPELEELDDRSVLEDKQNESKLSDLNEFGEGALGYEDFSEHAEDAFEAEEDEVTEELMIPMNQKKDDLLRPRAQPEEAFTEVGLEGRLKPPELKEGKMEKPACKEEDKRTMPPKIEQNEDGGVEEKEETWYFTWE